MRGLVAMVAALLVAAGVHGAPVDASAANFAIAGDHFELDGKPFVIRSGEMHYPRIPREFWRERMRQARAMGLNTITTYVFWNLHEPEPGRFDFSGNLDLAAFIRTAQEEGLKVVLRPGPYVCAEWDLGGFPPWLLRTQGLQVRSMDPRFLEASARYLRRVAQEVKPLLSSHGGPVLMVQVENEYGSYGSDRDYLESIHRQIVDAGFDVPLFTADGPDPHDLEGGTLPGVAAVVNFDGGAADVKEAFRALADDRPRGPRMAGEYWSGWFDHWGDQHHVTSVPVAVEAVESMLSQGISFNLYMFHGGTSFGWDAGANDIGGPFEPDTTSYDYDAPVNEAGEPTPKYFALREVIARHLPAGERLPEVPQSQAPMIVVPPFALHESVSLLDALPSLAKPLQSRLIRSMEAIGQNHGLVLYRKRLTGAARGTLEIESLRDYAIVLADGKPIATVDRRLGEHGAPVDLREGTTLDLLVEGMGRINFGAHLADGRKGITRSVSVGDSELLDWQIFSLPLDDLSALKFSDAGAQRPGPTFWHGGFDLDHLGSTYLDLRKFGKGYVWLNGHLLGRYWRIGPQQALFVPAPWLRSGHNEVVVLDLQSGDTAPGLQGLVAPVFETPAAAVKAAS